MKIILDILFQKFWSTPIFDEVAEIMEVDGVQLRLDLLEEAKKNTEDERMEIARLKTENRRLRMERDILKKAAAFFANEKN